MTTNQQNAIKTLVEKAVEHLGTHTAVANKCDCSSATISLIINGKYDGVKSPMWKKIASKLGFNELDWQYVSTYDIKMLHQVFDDAREKGLWFLVSSPAGSQKTSAFRTYQKAGTYYLECKNWSRRRFLGALANTLGLPVDGKKSWYELLEDITNYFQERSEKRMVLLVDQADRLQDQAWFTFIDLYNDLKGTLGVVWMGTEHLHRRMKTGVTWNKQGFDELESRFGRTYIHLSGISKVEFKAICEANGIKSEAVIQRSWNDCIPSQGKRANQTIQVVTDMRRLEKIIERELLMEHQDEPHEMSLG